MTEEIRMAMTLAQGAERLTALSAALLSACRKEAFDGTVLFTPDGVGNYDALWVRDFGYIAESCGDLVSREEIRRCIEFILRGQRADGWMPDRVEAGGEAVYAAGAKGAPVGLANLDNTPFLIFAVYVYFGLAGEAAAAPLFRAWREKLDRGMACIPLSADGLVYNEAAAPHSPYGFTDTVCKTGRLFMESVLFWRACRQMEAMHRALAGDARIAGRYDALAAHVERAVPALFDAESGAFLAADGDCRQIDIWGMLYALYVDFPFPAEIRARVEAWLLENRGRYIYKGQICQLPDGAPWEKLLIEVPAGEYQNGAYWATASGWALDFFRRADPAFAGEMLEALVRDFETDGVCECINAGYRKLPQFVVSAANVRGALLRNERS